VTVALPRSARESFGTRLVLLPMSYDITIWEQIRDRVELRTRTFVQDIGLQIANDRSLIEYHGSYPVPWQLREIMQQRAQFWVQRFYDPCCEAYKRTGKELSVEFDAAVWAFWIEPFAMKEVQTNHYGYRASMLLELLLCAVGSPPERRNLLKVGEKDCCFAVRLHIYETWYDKLHHLPPRINEALALMARANAAELRAARIVRGLPPEPVSTLPSVPPVAAHSSDSAQNDSKSITAGSA